MTESHLHLAQMKKKFQPVRRSIALSRREPQSESMPFDTETVKRRYESYANAQNLDKQQSRDLFCDVARRRLTISCVR